MKSKEEINKFLGKEVVVTVDEATSTIAEGKLLSWSEDGQFIIQDEMGFLHFCWPLLDIRLKGEKCPQVNTLCLRSLNGIQLPLLIILNP